MSNKSIKQITNEIKTAKRESLSAKKLSFTEVHISELEDGNTLIDIVSAQKNSQSSGKRKINPILNDKIKALFEKYPVQYKFLGLYYSGGFTTVEIAEMEYITRQSVEKTLRSAVKRLKKYLTESEYDSIRWLLRDGKQIPATVRMNYEGYSTYTAQVGEIVRPQNRVIVE